MKPFIPILGVFILILQISSCKHVSQTEEKRILFLHHSTGRVIWNGSASTSRKADLPDFFEKYNEENQTNYKIVKQEFPKSKPYGWNNYPYDYYNIWVKNQGEEPFMEEPTLEILTIDNDVIVFKHCYPASNIQENLVSANINSPIKTIANYKLQYEALKDKLHQYPDTKFILWTGAIRVKSAITEIEALRAKEFFNWVIEEWDQPNDNIFIWDFYHLETEGGLYLKEEYAVSSTDSHPNKDFAGRVAVLLFNRIIDVINTNGNGTLLTGEMQY